jgi:hypothetical protein
MVTNGDRAVNGKKRDADSTSAVVGFDAWRT